MDYNVHFRVNGNDLATVIDVCKKTCKLMSITPVDPTAAKFESDDDVKPRYKDGVRNKGITGAELLRKLGTAQRNFTMQEASDAFVQHGFAPSSVNASVSREVSAGTIKRIANGGLITYELVKKT
jgi:hypothetical protein